MQKKITAKQNKQYTTDKVVVVKKNNGKLEITQGQIGNLTGNLKVQVIGHATLSVVYCLFCLAVIFFCMSLAV
jgi:hypothetical protein